MTITFEPITGGLREIAANLLGSGEPVWLARMLAHNQELISDTFLPRHLVNDWAKVTTNDHSASSDGELIAQYGRFTSRPGMTVKIRINVNVGGDDVDFVAFAWPFLVRENWDDGDEQPWIQIKHSSTDQYDTVFVPSADPRGWYEMEIKPPPRGELWYLTLWAISPTPAAVVMYAISAVERKEFEAA
jgi:hypothetical protein